MDAEGLPLVAFDGPRGSPEDGAVFTRICARCRRFYRLTGEERVYYRADGYAGAKGFVCPRCGPFEPEMVGWESDYRP